MGSISEHYVTRVDMHTHTHPSVFPLALLTLIFVSYFVNLDRN